jgi:class 3 adenylate cyclase
MAASDDWKKIDDVLAWAYAILLQVERVKQCWEERFLLVAANHLVTAVNRSPRRSGIPRLARDLEGDIENLRDIYEHWEKLRHENISGRFLRPVVPDGRELVAEALVTDHEDDSLFASVTVSDADGQRVAAASETSVLLPARSRPVERSEPLLATVLFTDLVGSTALASELGDDRWRQRLAEHERVVRRQLGVFRGREIKTTGDGFLVTFDSPDRAVRCAQAIRDATRRLGMDVRAGVHTGQCELARGDISGVAVHLAARVLGVAATGEVLVSSTVRDLLLGSGLRFEDRGHHKLKGIEGEWPLFAFCE